MAKAGDGIKGVILSALIPSEVMAQLRAIAQDEQRNLSDVVRRVIKQGLATYPEQGKE